MTADDFRLVHGYGLVFTQPVDFLRGVDEPADDVTVSETFWDELIARLQKEYNVEIWEYEPFAWIEGEDDDGEPAAGWDAGDPCYVISPTGSLTETGPDGVLREFTTVQVGWADAVMAALRSIREAHPVLKRVVDREGKMVPGRFAFLDMMDYSDLLGEEEGAEAKVDP